jgi:hypothetical protein
MADTTLPPSIAWVEPRSDYEAEYPYNNVTQTESGHLFEMDDTPTAERIRLQHRTGTFTETQADGTQIHKVVGDHYQIIVKDNNVLIKGTCNITIVGNSVMHVQGDAYLQVDGNVNENVLGDVNQIVSGDLNSTVKGSTTITGKGGTTINSDVVVNGDLKVTGGISSSGSINAVTNVTAGSQVYAPLVMDGLGLPSDSILALREAYSIHTHLVPGIMNGSSVATAVITTSQVGP